MRRSLFIGGLACTALTGLATLPIAAVMAQGINAETTPPPENPTVDANGVDIGSGKPSYERLELLIGGNGIGALPYKRYGYNRTNFDNVFDISQSWTIPLYRPARSSAVFGNSAESFLDENPKLPSGSSLITIAGGNTGDYAYQKLDGTYVRFSHFDFYTHPNCCPNDPKNYSARSLASYVQYPNGVRWTYHYQDIQYSITNPYYPGTTITDPIVSRVQSITSNTGYQLKFYYASDALPGVDDNAALQAWARAIKVVAINNAYEYCNPTANSCTLTMAWPQVQYSSAPNTIAPGYFLTVTDATGGQTHYKNDGTVRFPGSPVDNRAYTTQVVPGPCPTNDYCASSRVVSANIDGKITNYAHSYNSSTNIWTVTSSGPSSEINTYTLPTHGDIPPTGSTTRVIGSVSQHVDPLNKTRSYEYQNGVAQYEYGSLPYPSGNLIKATLPEGNIFEFTRDAAGNVTQTKLKAKTGSGLADIVSSQTIGPFGQPLTKTDARGNVTTYTYNATHGGVLTETGPAVNGVAPVKRYAYAQRYAWIKNSSGAHVQAALPVWVKTEERTCKTSATSGNACAGGAGDEIVTTFDYGPNSGPNNLQLRGMVVTSDGVNLRTCYGYDIYGNKISETSPRAGLTSCS